MKRFGLWLAVLLASFVFFSGAAQCREQIEKAPSLALKDSIPIAEKSLSDAKIKIENFYLYSIAYANGSKGSYWYYTFRPTAPSEFNQVYVKVYMDRSVDVQHGGEGA